MMHRDNETTFRLIAEDEGLDFGEFISDFDAGVRKYAEEMKDLGVNRTKVLESWDSTDLHKSWYNKHIRKYEEELNMTRLGQLTKRISQIIEKHEEEIKKLDHYGPRGGSNAKRIKGWTLSPAGTVTRVFNILNDRTPLWIRLPYWNGYACTPSTAIPACIYNECKQAYEEIYG